MRATFLSLICVALLLPACNKANKESVSVPDQAQDTSSPATVTADQTESEVTKVSVNSTVEEEWGTIKGTIKVAGDVPAPAKIKPNKDVDFCGADKPIFENELVVAKDGGLKNAFLFLYLSRKPQDPPVHPSYEKTAEDTVELDNVGCMFEPHVVALRTSQILLAKNSDPKGHNTQNNSRVNVFNPLIPPKGEIEIKMKGPERLPTTVTCSIHPWMKAYMIVRDEPYVAITDEKGNFEIKNMPEGEWQFQFWHERCGYMTGLEKDGQPVMEGRPATVTLKVTNGEVLDLGTLTISADALKGDQ